MRVNDIMRLIIVGFGIVGQNLAKIIERKKMELLSEFGFRPRIVAIVDAAGAMIDSQGLDLDGALSVKKKGSVAHDPELGHLMMGAQEVIENIEAESVVELTPTKMVDGEPGLSHIKTALRCRKHVITANKAPLAIAMASLMEMASYNGVLLKYSGTVGGGTPILDFAEKCLSGNKIQSIQGILNGTTNYILTRMTESGVSMDAALKEAQASGYAEADPSSDVDGIDAACKLVILANSTMKRDVSMKDVEVEGIRRVTREDVEAAKEKGSRIKLVGTIDDGIRVRPEPVPLGHPLCVGGTLNAVLFRTELAGEFTIVGKGAGGPETASAVLRDIIDVRRSMAQ